MANPFESIDLNNAREQLHVEINKDGWSVRTQDDFTHISAEPPFQEIEILDIRERLADGELPGSGLSRLRKLSDREIYQGPNRITLDGRIDASKVKFGVALTAEVMSMRGLHTAIVSVDGEPAHLVREKNEAELAGEHVTIIDADEFKAGIEADSNDPEWQAFLKKAREVGKRQAEIDYQREHADEVHIVEATDVTAVLRSPKTKNLYGISMDQGPDGEKVNVTELEELEAERQSEQRV